MVTQTANDGTGKVKANVLRPSIRTYKPRLMPAEYTGKMVFDVIPAEIFASRELFIMHSRKGIPGQWVKKVIDATGMRDTFLNILNVSSGNLSRVYRRKALDKEASEEVLDAVRLLGRAVEVWESSEMAQQWLYSRVPALGGERPVDLLDTFEGRRWVSQVLNKVEHGEFS